MAHKVLPDQLEIDPATGRVKPIQAARHEVSLWTMDLNLTTRLGILRWLDVRLRFPLRFVRVSAQFQDKVGQGLQDFVSIHHRDEILVGVGDPDLQFGFRPFRFSHKQRWLLEFGGGVSFPLGRIEPDPYIAGREGRWHQHIMFGSGTFDPMGFITAGYLAPMFQIYANFSIRGSVYANRYKFQSGLQLKSGLSAESGFGLRHWSFQLQAAILLQQAGLWDGKVDPDAASGRTDLLLGVGVFWRPNTSWQVFVRASVPINLHLVGGELIHPIILGLGLNYQFRLFR